jgi:hypothetical protein
MHRRKRTVLPRRSRNRGDVACNDPVIAARGPGTSLERSTTMLFGGRPLPRMSPGVRLVVVLLVIYAASSSSTIRLSGTLLMDRFLKMSSEQVEAKLANVPLWGAAPGSDRDVQCEPATRGWDYICSFAYGPKAVSKRLKVGVRVGHASITKVSSPHELDARYIAW